MKIIHLPTSVGGNSWGLSSAERRIGLDSTVLVKYDNWLHYPADIVLNGKKKDYIKAFFDIRDKYDVFHYNFGETLINFYAFGHLLTELDLLGDKKLFVTYNGCDARQTHTVEGINPICAECSSAYCTKTRSDERKRAGIKDFDEHKAHFFALNPDFMRFLPERTVFLPYTIPGWDDIVRCPMRNNRVFTIVHAPTNRRLKGTDYVIEAVNRLRENYSDRIKLVLVENMTHADAIKAYLQADLVIDQMVIGWYGALSTECMKMGKPVAAYINDSDLRYLPSDMARDCKEAIINISPDNVHEIIGELYENRENLWRITEAQLEYVHKYHNPIRIAQKVRSLYESV